MHFFFFGEPKDANGAPKISVSNYQTVSGFKAEILSTFTFPQEVKVWLAGKIRERSSGVFGPAFGSQVPVGRDWLKTERVGPRRNHCQRDGFPIRVAGQAFGL